MIKCTVLCDRVQLCTLKTDGSLVYLGCLSVLFDNISPSVRILDPGAKL